MTTHREIDIIKSSGNVFKDLEIKNSDKYIAKAELARQINNIIKKSKLKQNEAAKLLEIDQPKISALNCGRLDAFSVERLLIFLNKLDQGVKIVVRKKPINLKRTPYLRVAFC